MFSDIRRLVNAISVRERGDEITISGLPSDVMQKDIRRIWKTSKINSHMFVSQSRSAVRFPKFFAVEFLYALRTINVDAKSIISKRSIKKVIDLLFSETWLKDTLHESDSKMDFTKLKLFSKTPLPHQTEFLHTYDLKTQQYNLKGYMLAAAAGSGKTLTGLFLKEVLGLDAMIVVCPKNAIEKVWVNAIKTEYRKPKFNYWTSLSTDLPTGDEEFIICHYESLTKLIPILSRLKGREYLIDLDESHNMNEISADRTQNFVKLCLELDSKDIIWASGTPIKAIGKEAIPFLSTIDPYFNSDVEDRFKKVFGINSGRAGDMLANRLGISAFKVPKKDVMAEPPIEEEIKISMPNGSKYTLESIGKEMKDFIQVRFEYYQDNRSKYEDIYLRCLGIYESTISRDRDREELTQYKQFVRMIRSTTDYYSVNQQIVWCNKFEKEKVFPTLSNEDRKLFRNARSVVKYVALKIRGEALGRILSRRRIECHQDMLKHVDWTTLIDMAEKKTILFTSFQDVVKDAGPLLKSHGYNPSLVYSDTNAQIKPIIDKFTNDAKSNPLVATYQSLSTAVPIVAANNVILVNQPFRHHEREQAISRSWRLGQDTRVRVINLLLDTGDEANVSTRSNDIMAWSKEQVDLILGTNVDESSLESYSVDLNYQNDLFMYSNPYLRW